MNIAFEPAAHIYRLDGSVVPNVTRILGDLYDWASVPRDVLERKRQIGEAVHAAIELELKNDLDEASIDPTIAGYFEAWKRFRREKKFECYLSECRVASKKFRYAGTLDLSGDMNGSDALIDTKNAYRVHPATALQTAAYLHACSEMGFIRSSAKRFALHLQPEGTYRLEPYTDRNDFPIFLSCLSRYNWLAKHGLNKEVS